MTDRELAQAAWDELTKTTVTYAKWKGQGFTVGHWLNAQNYLNQIDVPAPPPQTAFGLSLPARMPEATGRAADAKNIRYVNIINVDNGEVAFKSYTAGVGNTISHSLSHGNPQGATYGTFDGVVSLLTGDPLLDAAFRPQAGSPAIGAGDPAYTPTVDLNGKTRVTADIGAVAA